MKIVFTLIFSMFSIFPSHLQSQNTESVLNRQTKKSFVSVPVTVSDREGRYIADLEKEDFTVFQDGVEQKISFFSTYDEPLDIVLLLDTSKSTRDVIGKIRSAAKEFVGSLKQNDKCQVATFDSQVKIFNSFTSDKGIIKNSLDAVKVNDYGGTLLFNAVDRISRESFNNVEGRKVIILLTDGNNFGGSLTKEQFLGQLEESDILIYTVFFKTSSEGNSKTAQPNKKSRKTSDSNSTRIISLSAEEIARLEKQDETEAIDSLTKMSDITAGRFYQSSVTDLKKSFKNIIGELTRQYRLGYNAPTSTGGAAARDITVKVNRPDVVVRTRGTSRGE